MSLQAKTDREQAFNAHEFVWEGNGLSDSHRFLITPVVELLRSAPAAKVLDLGCGNGAVSGLLASQGFQVSGLDHSASGLEIAQRSFPEVCFERFDLAVDDLPETYQASFDAVVSLEVLEHLFFPRRLLKIACDALKPGGTLLVSTPYHGYFKNLALALTGKFDAHWHPLRDYGHIKFFSKRTLLQLFEESGLEVTSYRTAGRIPPLACSMIVAAKKPR